MNDTLWIVIVVGLALFDIILGIFLHLALKEITLNRVLIMALERKLEQLTESRKDHAESTSKS